MKNDPRNHTNGHEQVCYGDVQWDRLHVLRERDPDIGTLLRRKKGLKMEGVGMTPELETLKARLRATWIAGDFGQIAKSTASGAEDFIKRLNLQSGMKVLDVACGTGNLALPAARAGAIVTGVDIAPNLIKQARENAEREGLKIQFDEGDAEALSYEDASFDAVVTMFGAMFAPRPEFLLSIDCE